MSKKSKNKRRREKAAAAKRARQEPRQSKQEPNGQINLEIAWSFFRRWFVLGWAIASTAATLWLTYIQLLPKVDVSYIHELQDGNKNRLPLRITNSGYFDITVTNIEAVGNPYQVSKCLPILGGVTYDLSMDVASDSIYDIIINVGEASKAPGKAIDLSVNYSIPALHRTATKNLVMVPYKGQDGMTLWLFGNIKNVNICEPGFEQAKVLVRYTETGMEKRSVGK